MKERELEVLLANTKREIEDALSLRFEIFNEELNQGLEESYQNKKDRDFYDEYCDHLIVLDRKKNNRVVGTYRILHGETAGSGIGFYSENEFNLSSLEHLKPNIMEIGRSCVHKEYRDGSVIKKLWEGLADYIVIKNIKYVIGCASLHTKDAGEISEIYSYLKLKNYLSDNFSNICAREGFRLPGFTSDLEIQDPVGIKKKIPGLLKGYFRAGAVVCGEPALDSNFGTVDFFVLLDADRISEKYGRKFIKNQFSTAD